MPTDVKKRVSVKQNIKIAGRTSLRIVDKSIRGADKTLRGTEHVKRTVNRNIQHAKDVYENQQENIGEYGQKKITETSEYAGSLARIAASKAAAKAMRKATSLKPDINEAATEGASRIKLAHTSIQTAKRNLQTVSNTKSNGLIRKAQKELFDAQKQAAKDIFKVTAKIVQEGGKAIAKGAALLLGGTGLAVLLICAILLGGAFVVFSAGNPDAPPPPQPVIASAIYYYLRSEVGLNSAAACGVTANIQFESGFNLTAIGDNGTSYGLCQWHDGRWDRLTNFCVENGYSESSLQGQVHYLGWELENIYGSLLDKLRAVEDNVVGCYDAAYMFCMEFERPRDAEIKSDDRGTAAMLNYWPLYGAKELDGMWTEQGMKLAMTAYDELGNGGTKYWSWYGFPNRVEWCAIFVSWCGAQCGFVDAGIMPKSANVDNAESGYQWYYNHADVAVAAPDMEPAPGWVAFFGRGHTGIVFAVADGQVYLVEGNSGDSVNINSYALETIRDNIWGYGIPNFAY